MPTKNIHGKRAVVRQRGATPTSACHHSVKRRLYSCPLVGAIPTIKECTRHPHRPWKRAPEHPPAAPHLSRLRIRPSHPADACRRAPSTDDAASARGLSGWLQQPSC
eukprot:8043470-Pyramimonas_sp.AAC.1